jgi:excisionase family DNA binding protein
MQPHTPTKKLYSVNEAAYILGLGRTSLYGLMKSKELQVVKIGRRTLVPASAIDALITSRNPTICS